MKSTTLPDTTQTVHYLPVFDALPYPTLLLKPDAPRFSVLACNAAYAQLLEVRAKDLEGNSFFEVLDRMAGSNKQEQEERFSSSLHLAAGAQQSHTMPQIALGGAAGVSHISHTPVTGAQGEVQYIIQTVMPASGEADLVATAAAPSSLSDSRGPDLDGSAAYLQTVIDTTATGIFLFTPVTDDAGRIVDFRFRIANHTLAAYVGQKGEDVTGELGSKWFPSFKTNGLFDYYLDTYLTGQPHHFEFHYYGDGVDSWLDILSTLLNGDVLVTFSDITQLKQLQQKMELSMAALKRSNNNLEQFAYVASHDLQEPLRKIKSFGDILAGRYSEALGPDGVDLITRMQGASHRMKMLIEDLLIFSRISFQENTHEQVNLNEIIREVLADLEPSIKDKKAEITISDMQPVQGDATQLRQAFQNLLSNAIKFSKPGDRPKISISADTVTGSETQGFHLAPEQRRKTYQQIVVRDNGIGFEQQYAERIFQIFQRLHGRMDYPGTGVGLSIVQKVAENHKGFIKADSTPQEGAAFTLLLPVTAQAS